MVDGKLIVALGGTLRAGSSTEAAMRRVLAYAERQGASTKIFAAERLALPLYVPGSPQGSQQVDELITSLRNAHAIVLASPGYHGGISGVVKNAIDHVEEMAKDSRPYFSGKLVGCIASAAGWQASNATLHALRSVVHSLRGWPTPLGIAFNSSAARFDETGRCLIEELEQQFAIMGRELLARIDGG